MCIVDSGSVNPRQSYKTVWCTLCFYKREVYKHLQVCISFVYFVNIFTRSFDNFISMKFLIAVFFPASPFIPTSPFTNFGDFCQSTRLLHPSRLPVYSALLFYPSLSFLNSGYAHECPFLLWNIRISITLGLL